MDLNKVNTPYYNDYGTWIRRQFPYRVQKISIDAGFTCPNRDGRISTGGCIYCDNRTFNPSYCQRRLSVSAQLAEGKQFFAHKYPDMKYLAYFQAFTNTYAPIEQLKALYEEALAELSERTFVLVEYGLESCNAATLQHINRGHTFEQSVSALERTHQRGLLTGAHIILGLPGEDAAESLRQAPILSQLPIDILKIHQMQIIRGTKLAKMYEREPFHIYSVDEYIELIAQYIQRLRPDMVLERFVSQSPKELLIAPHWGLKNYEFTNKLVNYLKQNDIHQGQLVLRNSE